MNPESNGMYSKHQESTKGNQLSIFLLLIPVAALIFAYFQRRYFIPPVNFKAFLIFVLKTASAACLFLFLLSFWKCRKDATLVMILIILELFWGFAGLALLTIVNVKYDRSETKVFEKKLLQIYRSSRRPRLIRVEPWGNQEEWLEVPDYKIAGAQPLKTVVHFTTRKGRLGFEYITSVEIKN